MAPWVMYWGGGLKVRCPVETPFSQPCESSTCLLLIRLFQQTAIGWGQLLVGGREILGATYVIVRCGPMDSAEAEKGLESRHRLV